MPTKYTACHGLYIETALSDAKVKISQVDNIAVTTGPGLIGSLLVGTETAKALCDVYKINCIPVNHLSAHIYSVFLEKSKSEYPKFPILALVVSGGHTDLIYMKNHRSVKLIGTTRDDAAGEAFDKIGRILGLSYPGGVYLSKMADNYLKSKNQIENMFPRPMINSNNFDFSFSGLKTSVFTHISKQSLSKEKIAAEVQESIVDTLLSKTYKAFKTKKPNSIIISGGVSANNHLRKRFTNHFSKYKSVKLYFPKLKYCTDNAAPIACCSFFKNQKISISKIKASPSLKITDKP